MSRMRYSQLSSAIEAIVRCEVSQKNVLIPAFTISIPNYIFAIAIIRSLTGAINCKTGNASKKFHPEKDECWTFCTMGVCTNKECMCDTGFTGRTCNKPSKKCWGYSCFLTRCGSSIVDAERVLKCQCRPELKGQTTTTGYFIIGNEIKENYQVNSRDEKCSDDDYWLEKEAIDDQMAQILATDVEKLEEIYEDAQESDEDSTESEDHDDFEY